MAPDQSDEREDPLPRWSDLPADLLDIISQKMTDIVDFVRFRCVCGSWRRAAKPSNLARHPQLPWLLLPYDPETSSRSFFSLSMRSIYTLDLPETRDHIICRPSNGDGRFLLVSKNLIFSLFNPLTRSLVRLASAPKLPRRFAKAGDWIKFDGVWITIEMIESYFAFCCAFVSPHSSDVVLAFMSLYHRTIYYWRSGDEAWSTLDYRGLHDLPLPSASMAFFKDRLYVMDDWGQTVICDLQSQNQDESIVVHSLYLDQDTHHHFIPLPEQLLLVTSEWRDTCPYEIPPPGFHSLVLKCHALEESELNQGMLYWSCLKEAGDLTAFLTHAKHSGGRRSLICVVPLSAGYKSNRLYHIRRPLTKDGRLCGKDVIISEEDKYMIKRRCGYSPPLLGSFTWIIPSLD